MKARKLQFTAFNHVDNFFNWELFQIIFLFIDFPYNQD